MTKEAIIEEIKKHPREDQREIIEAVWEPSEEDQELRDEEKDLVDRRWRYYQSWWIEKEKGHTLRITTKSFEGVTYALP
ncbi:hypothetical protein [Alkalispirochaeta alkalica]|uniref:hypothetical protein n=1 Tax=Alkalispirochaeta alkalica TaxID=46356 RepID=UPI00037279C6|nr:hypothetical protein [Alkalispirochaeta alkalica]